MAPRRSRSIPQDFNLPELELRRRLIAGTHRGTLEIQLGKQLYRELRSLAIATRKRAGSGGRRVYLLPGIMGSRLGYSISGNLHKVLWIDPDAIAAGRLTELALPGKRRIRALGVQIFMYLKLKLQLERAGFDVRFHAYDWRRDVLTLGRELIARIRDDAATPVALVAHSMGGLVARAAMARDSDRHIARLVMLGTPNFGSFASVLALRGAYPPVHKIAMLDHKHDPDAHARRVFVTFPGLCQLLPATKRATALDLHKPSSWPEDGPRPSAALLTRGATFRARLAPADERCALIAGVDQETVTGVVRRGREFIYQLTRNGDGTVPLERAALPGARTYYVREGHSELPTNNQVIAAVIDLITRANTDRLPRRWRQSRSRAGIIHERHLRSAALLRRDWHHLSTAEQRDLLEGIVFPGPSTTPA